MYITRVDNLIKYNIKWSKSWRKPFLKETRDYKKC